MMKQATMEHKTEQILLIEQYVQRKMQQKTFVLRGEDTLLLIGWLREAWAEIEQLKQGGK